MLGSWIFILDRPFSDSVCDYIQRDVFWSFTQKMLLVGSLITINTQIMLHTKWGGPVVLAAPRFLLFPPSLCYDHYVVCCFDWKKDRITFKPFSLWDPFPLQRQLMSWAGVVYNPDFEAIIFWGFTASGADSFPVVLPSSEPGSQTNQKQIQAEGTGCHSREFGDWCIKCYVKQARVWWNYHTMGKTIQLLLFDCGFLSRLLLLIILFLLSCINQSYNYRFSLRVCIIVFYKIAALGIHCKN